MKFLLSELEQVERGKKCLGLSEEIAAAARERVYIIFCNLIVILSFFFI